MAIVLTLLAIFILLCINELWWRTHRAHNEFSRKFIHITIGVFTAFWPFYLSFTQIKYLAALGLLFFIFSKYFNVLKSIHNVERKTWGEIYSALIVGILAFLTHNKWLFAASFLQIALADGLAAVIGVKYGKNSQYKVLGQTKSIVGSLTFFVCSFVILIVFKESGHLMLNPVYLGLVSIIATVLENVGVKGLDNIFVPVAVLALLVR